MILSACVKQWKEISAGKQEGKDHSTHQCRVICPFSLSVDWCGGVGGGLFVSFVLGTNISDGSPEYHKVLHVPNNKLISSTSVPVDWAGEAWGQLQ